MKSDSHNNLKKVFQSVYSNCSQTFYPRHNIVCAESRLVVEKRKIIILRILYLHIHTHILYLLYMYIVNN